MSDKPAPPSAEHLAELLGTASDLWIELQGAIRAEFAPVTERWVYGGARYGWSCRLERRRKGILYMTPDAGQVRVGVALSDAARETALSGDLPIAIREGLVATTKAMEGWPVRLAVRTPNDLASVLTLARIKLAR
jgi:hypothetical protein